MAAMRLSNGFEMNVEVLRGIVPADTLLIHGNLASNNWWQPAINQWLKKLPADNSESFRGRLILAEWRGCGLSAAPKSRSELHPGILADDYLKLLFELEIKKVNLVGHSMGGLIGLFAVMKAPELFERLVLLDPVGPRGARVDPAKYEALEQMRQDRGFCASVLGTTIYGNDFSSPLFDGLVNDAFGCAEDVWHGIPDALQQINIVSQLAEIRHPTLVLHGEFDTTLPIEDSVFLAENLGRARFHELKGQGHSTNVENPALFVNTVDDFLFQLH